MLVDAHTHFFSHDFFQTLARQSRVADPLAVVAGAGIELPPEDSLEHAQRWLGELSRCGVERAVSFASVPPEAAAVLAASAATEGRLIPYLMCDPSRPEGIEATVRGLRDGGRGVLLFPAIQHFEPGAPLLDGLYEEAAARKAPVVVHCGVLSIKLRDLLGVRPQYDIRFANPLAVVAAAERHRDVAFVLPHFGGGFFREALLAGAQSPNIYVDTSSSNSWMRTQPEDLDLATVFARTLTVFGPERILFGTDSSTFPRGWRTDLFEAQDAALGKAGADDAVKRRVFGANLDELLER